MDCELCGRRAGGKARVEGTVINVCEDCSRFGEKIFESRPVEIREKPKIRSPEEIYFVPNFSSKIRQKRESLSLSREQLAEKIKEKENVLERVEKGARPQKQLAEKLEKFLGIHIISSIEAEKATYSQNSQEPLTLGDIVTIKKRKK